MADERNYEKINMSTPKTMLKKLNILKSLFLISLIGVVGFMTTQALFIDREESEESAFQVGTLDMDVTGPGSSQAESLQVTGVGAQNVVSGGKSWIINNTGSLPGEFSFELANLKNFENGCNEPEGLVDTSCDNPGASQGELGTGITTTLILVKDGQEREILTSNLSDASAANYATLWKNNAGSVIIPPGKKVTVTMNWSTADAQFENEAQSDSVAFDVYFNLQQVAQGNTQGNP